MTREQMIDEAVRCVKGKERWALYPSGIVVSGQWYHGMESIDLLSHIRTMFSRIATRERCVYKSDSCTIC